MLNNTGSFRNILVIPGKTEHYTDIVFSPPHDIIGQPITDHIFDGDVNNIYFDMLEKAHHILSNDNDTKANGIWFWGASVAPQINGASDEKRLILSETTLMRGIAALADIPVVSTPEDDGLKHF